MLESKQSLPNWSAADAKVVGEPAFIQPQVLMAVIDPHRHDGAFECVVGTIRQRQIRAQSLQTYAPLGHGRGLSLLDLDGPQPLRTH